MIRINNFRIIARLDIKNEYVIKGIHLEGLRKVGNPYELACKYYQDGADEIILNDTVASLYGRNNLFDVLKKSCEKVFIPIIIGGGLRSLADVEAALEAGADRVFINTGLIKNPKLIIDITKRYGSQCLSCSIEAKALTSKKWSVYYDCGREDSQLDAMEWIKQVQDLGVGEILLTSIDNEGTKNGFEIPLYEAASKVAHIPIIASGGAGRIEHIISMFKSGLVRGIALASILHYNISTISDIKKELIN